MPEVAAEFGAGLVCAHTGGALPRTRPFRVSYGTTTRGVVDAVISQVTAAAERAVAAGVAREKVLIDPAHDFGKNTFHGLLLLRHVADLVMTGWPVLMALSNKDVVGETLGVDLTERRGTLAATALAAAAGARMFRVHEVAATRRVLEMVASIQGSAADAHGERTRMTASELVAGDLAGGRALARCPWTLLGTVPAGRSGSWKRQRPDGRFRWCCRPSTRKRPSNR